jgi:hypothetical protein
MRSSGMMPVSLRRIVVGQGIEFKSISIAWQGGFSETAV